jgi:hypothetical protein
MFGKYPTARLCFSPYFFYLALVSRLVPDSLLTISKMEGRVIRPASVLLLAFLVLLASTTSILAQQSGSGDEDLQSTLKKLAADAAKSYVAPISSGFGADLNSGWFHRAPRASLFGFDLEFGVVAMGTFFTDQNKSFSSSGVFQFDSSQASTLTNFIRNDSQYGITQQQRDNVQRSVIQQLRGRDFSVGLSGPTVVGKKSDSVRVQFNGTTLTVTDPNTGLSRQVSVPTNRIPLPVTGLLEDAPALPLATPQVTIGTFLGTQFTFRYLPEVEVDPEIGKFKYFGFGIQHNPAVWLGEDALPLEISASFFTQTMTVGSLFEAKATAFGINASKRLGWGFLNLTPYAGFLLESSSMTFTYDYSLDTPTGRVPQQVRFELEGENKSRFTAGMSVKILLFNVNADYNWGAFNSVSAGVMIII